MPITRFQLSKIMDGTTRTILVAEVEGGAIPWMEPRDLNMPAIAEPDREKHMPAFRATARNLLKQGLADGDHHSKGAHFLFADQHVEPLRFADGIRAASHAHHGRLRSDL